MSKFIECVNLITDANQMTKIQPKNLKYNVSGVEAQLRIHPPEDAALYQETQLSLRVKEMKLHPKTLSEGYETMTPDSSDIVSEVKQIL